MTLTFDGKLFTSPAGEDKQLHRVLDAGTGTGIWAMDFGKITTFYGILAQGYPDANSVEKRMSIPSHMCVLMTLPKLSSLC